VLCAASQQLSFDFVIFLGQNIGAKVEHKMLMKISPE